MSRFSHIASRAISGGKTSTFVFEELRGQPEVDLTYTGSSNKPYLNAKLAATSVGGLRSRKNLAKMNEKLRDIDRELFPKYVIKGWRNVQLDDGADAPFTVADAADFISQVPADMFDECRVHADDPSNYRDELPDMAETVKNSESD